jgi:class 3 adenylate cyclase/tetratricopeptide (TPR) repeat protein
MENAPGHKFCKKCGQALATAPAHERDARFTSPHSYTPKHLADKILTSKSALEGERKQVTVLFCDIANSTALAERLGPEPMHDLLDQFFELALGEVHRYEGTINQFLGDGFMALFGAPRAHEDDARRAVLAALGIERRLRDWRAEKADRATGTVQVRMGLNTGFVVVGRIGDNLRMDYTAVGDTTNLAARLEQSAEPGVILISETTHRLVQGMVRTERLEPLKVKGKSEPVLAWRLLGLGPRRSPLEERPSRSLGEFVGRQREIGVLQDLFAQMVAGQGQVVGVVGEPGMGKSRLLHEFRGLLEGERVTLLEGRCVSYGSSIPYLPWIDILRSNCGIAESDGPAAVTDKVALSLREVGMNPDEWAAYLLPLVGVKGGHGGARHLSPQAIKARTFETLRQLSLKGSRRRRRLVVEDLHWIDLTSEEYVVSLVESLTAAPILLVTTYRPGYRPPWMDRSYATQITLRPLGRQDSLAVVRSASPSDTLSGALSETILGKAEGNPFFLEELALAVIGDRRADQAIPDTVQGVITARIDRLSEGTKRLVRTAAVIGREFSVRLLDKIWDGGGPLHPHLLELKRLEFVYERAGGEEPVYVFKHALTQDVAYEGLLTHRRQILHGGAARALEEIHADRLDEVYGALAFHYARSEFADKAVAYLMLMADKAARVYANAEALAHLGEALAHLERLPPDRERNRLAVEVALRQAFSMYFLGRFEESVDLLHQQQDRLEQLDDPSLAGRFHFWLAHMQSRLGNQALATRSARRAIEEANRCGDEATLGKAHGLLALEGYWSGQPAEGIEHGRQAVALLEPAPGQQWFLGMAHFYMAMNCLSIGAFDDALLDAARTHAVAEAIADPRLECYAAFTEGWVHAMRGDGESAAESCERSRKMSPDPVSHVYASGFLGYVHVERGEPAEAIALLEHAVQELARFGFPQWHGMFTASLAEAYRLAGDAAQAQTLAHRGLEIARGARYWFGVGYAQRVLARIARSADALDEAESELTEALETFQSIGAEFEVARVRLELADLAGHRRDRERARTHLEPARRTFERLSVPRYLDRADRLARKLGLTRG